MKVISACKHTLSSWLLCVLTFTSLQAATFQEQVDLAVSAFSEGDYITAYWQIETLELDYGDEPEFVDPEFQIRTLPIRAYASLMADRPTDALIYFRKLLLSHQPKPAVRAFVLYNIAVAYSQTGASAKAAESYKNFREIYPNSNEAALALLQEADLRNQFGQTEAALTLLDNFYLSDGPTSLRMQARLKALQIASDTMQVDRTTDILFNTDWSVQDMPDIAVLSFSALEAGNLFLENGHYSNAIRAYRLVYPRDVLAKKQRERLLATQYALETEAAFASSIWKSHSQQLISRLQRQLSTLEGMEDYTPALYLRSGQAYLLASRFREATILFRTVALDQNFDKDTRAQAHYRWIVSLCEAETWQTARDVADTFLAEHPQHALAQSALFLISRSYQGEGQFNQAIEVLDQLIANYPKDPQAARWYYTRGYNYCVLENQPKARENFSSGLEQFPKSPLAEQTELWLALTYFFERNYTESLKRLDALLTKAEGHPLEPEVLFRIANCHYAERDYEQTLEIADTLIETFPDHHRVNEMLALKGDTYMGLGELIKAASIFRKVPADDAQIFDYATFQANKIYKALERFDLMQTHLEAYVAREDANERPRVSEALYWIGWSLQQENRAEEAFPIFEDALTRFGNDPKARAVGSILSAFAKLHRQHEKQSNQSVQSFDIWLQQQTETSLTEAKLTWFARLTLFRADLSLAQGNAEAADNIVLTIHPFVPIGEQDPQTLARVGILLAEKGYSVADEYFEYILDEYPKRSERAAAYYGKALLASEQNQLDSARRWLTRFLEETPTHPLAADARLLVAEIFTRQGLYEAAAAICNEILQLKAMRGRPHARALAELARIQTEQAQLKPAIAYWQRIYTLYRAYPELIAEAYWQSAQLFLEIGDPVAARNTLTEMLEDSRLSHYDAYQAASDALPQYEAAAKAYTELTELPKETEAIQ